MPSQSSTISALALALAKFQGQVPGAAKNATNPHLKNKYADLASIWDAIREPLTANGLSVVQLPAAGENGTILLHTRLLHESGEWIESEIHMPLGKQDPQGYGSALSYARRYGLVSLLGVVQEDDDGEGAMKRDTRPRESAQAEPQKAATGGGLTDAQLKRLFAIGKSHGLTPEDVRAVMKRKGYGIGGDDEAHTSLLSRSQYDDLCAKVLEQAGQAKAKRMEEGAA